MATELQPSSITSSWLVSIHGANDKWHISSGSIELIIYHAFNVTRKKKNLFPFSRQHVRCLQIHVDTCSPIMLKHFLIKWNANFHSKDADEARETFTKLVMMKFRQLHFLRNPNQTKLRRAIAEHWMERDCFVLCLRRKKSDFDNILHVRHSTRFLNESLNKNTL